MESDLILSRNVPATTALRSFEKELPQLALNCISIVFQVEDPRSNYGSSRHGNLRPKQKAARPNHLWPGRSSPRRLATLADLHSAPPASSRARTDPIAAVRRR